MAQVSGDMDSILRPPIRALHSLGNHRLSGHVEQSRSREEAEFTPL